MYLFTRFLDTRGKEILNIYEKTGKKKEAANLRMQLEHAKVALKRYNLNKVNNCALGGKEAT